MRQDIQATKKTSRETSSKVSKSHAPEPQTEDDLAEILLSCLNARERDVLERRYGLRRGKTSETLDSIGKSYSVTRERVRQIERASLQKIKRLQSYKTILEEIIAEIDALISRFGGVIAHQRLLEELLKKRVKDGDRETLLAARNRLVFVLEGFISEFLHFKKSNGTHKDGWSKSEEKFTSLTHTLNRIEEFLKRNAKPVLESEIAKHLGESLDAVSSYLHLSSKVGTNPFGHWGFLHWSEVTPRRMADRIYLVLKKNEQPLHYKEIAKQIAQHYKRQVHAPTVHNELIADDRFVLVGRGIYALKEWGYVSGTVRYIVEETLKKASLPMTRADVVAAVLRQRIVARSTILLALNSNSRIRKVGRESYQFKKK